MLGICHLIQLLRLLGGGIGVLGVVPGMGVLSGNQQNGPEETSLMLVIRGKFQKDTGMVAVQEDTKLTARG